MAYSVDWKKYVEEHKAGLPHAGGAADACISPLHCAVWNQDIEKVRLLLGGRDSLVFRDWYTDELPEAGLLCEQPIHYAARIGAANILAVLAQFGADLTARAFSQKMDLTARAFSQKMDYGPTVLHFAVARGYPEAVKILLELLPCDESGGKASMNMGDSLVLESLQEIHNLGPDGLRKDLEQEPGKLTCFLDSFPNELQSFLEKNPSAAQRLVRRDPEKINSLLEQILKGPLSPDSVFKNTPRAYGDTPLQVAVKMAVGESHPGWMSSSPGWPLGGVDRLGVVEALLKAPGASPDAGYGSPRALWWATRAGDATLIELLLKHGADPMLAAYTKDKYFIDGEDVLKNEEVCPLHLALRMERGDLAELMLPYVNFKTETYKQDSIAILYEAVLLNNERLVQELLQKGANPFSWNSGAAWRDSLRRQVKSKMGVFDKIKGLNGWHPLNPFLLAVNQDRYRIVEMFLNSPYAQNAWLDEPSRVQTGSIRGLSALHLAARKGFPQIVRLLLSAGAQVDSVTEPFTRSSRATDKEGNDKEALLLLGGETPLLLVLQALRGEMLGGKKGMRKRYISTLKLLLGAGANVDAADCEGNTPRQIAALCKPDVQSVFRKILGKDFRFE